MSTPTIPDDNKRNRRSMVGTTARVALALKSPRGHPGPLRTLRWQTVLFWIGVIALFAIALTMRLYNLALPYDRDGYDEGVYWQSLRAMSTGHPLYNQIFYSQPPFFLLSVYPFFVLFGSTLWSARLGVAVISLLGLVGAFLLGKALNGRVGALAALLLLVADPLYLAQSQTLQAEAPSAALGLLAVGLAFLWWENPEGRLGIVLAVLTGIALSLSILTKLLGVSCIVPIAILLVIRVWHIWQQEPAKRFVRLRPILFGLAACFLTMVLLLLPFFSSSQQIIQSVITFHNDAGNLPEYADWRSRNVVTMQHLLTSILALAAVYGAGVAIYRREWRVVPLLLWLFVTIYMLWRLVPLFHHHLVALIPPLIGLAILGIGPIARVETSPAPTIYGLDRPIRRMVGARLAPALAITGIALLMILAASVLNGFEAQQYYRNTKIQSTDPLVREGAKIAVDLRGAITPDQLVITDAQFIAGLADRNTPPSLVDTSLVRIDTGYVTLSMLIAEASNPQVHAIVFFTGRFYLPKVYGFHAWVAQHFHLLHNYGLGRELWVK